LTILLALTYTFNSIKLNPTIMEVFSNPVVVWFLAGLVLLLLEFLIPGVLVLFFGLGAWVTALFCLLIGGGIGVQFFVFGLSSVVMLLLLRKPLMKRLYKTSSNIDPDEEFIGHTGVCETAITPEQDGKVSFKGTQWAATASESVGVGDKVVISSKEGLKLVVSKEP
jgi:membrane protein implicated in regulation of membrane protease activity